MQVQCSAVQCPATSLALKRPILTKEIPDSAVAPASRPLRARPVIRVTWDGLNRVVARRRFPA
jgi:hypothetical protein